MSPNANRKPRSVIHHHHLHRLSNSSSLDSLRDSSRTAHDTSHRGTVREIRHQPPMQTKQEPYSPRTQHTQRDGVILPPGKDDLEILENLKQLIKNGQHKFYRAIPQPIALASLYLGKISTSEQNGPPTPQEVGKTASTHQTDMIVDRPVSPIGMDRRPSRLQGKSGWEDGSPRKGSMSAPNGHREGSHGYRRTLPDGPSATMNSAISESAPSPLSGMNPSPRNVLLTSDPRPPGLGYPDNLPASDDSRTAASSSPTKVAPSPIAERMDMRDRDHAYKPKSNGYAAPHSRDDKQSDGPQRPRRDSYPRVNDRYPRNSGGVWKPPPPPEQRQYKPVHENPPRVPFVKTEEVPISLSDLDFRGPAVGHRHNPPTGPAASSQVYSRNGGSLATKGRSLAGEATSLTEGRAPPPGISHSAQPGHRLPLDPSSGPGSDFKTQINRSTSFRMERDTIGKPAIDTSSRAAEFPSMAPPHNNARFPPPRQPEKYSRPVSPTFPSSNGLPRAPAPSTNRDDNRGLPQKAQPPRDFRHPREYSREREFRPSMGSSYRPDYDDRRIERIDVDDPRYNDDRHYRAPSPPPSADITRDRQRQMQRLPPSPRNTSGELPYEPSSGRRYSGPPPPSSPSRDWYPPSQNSGSYQAQRWDDDPYRARPANWDSAHDRDRFETDAPKRGWEGRSERDPRDSYRVPSPLPAPIDDRYLPARDSERGRPRPPTPTHDRTYPSRVRPRSPSPIRLDSRPPLKRPRDDYPAPPGDYYPALSAPAQNTRDSIRRPSDDYLPSRGATPPPPSTTSTTFYDRSGPPPNSASTILSGERDREFVRPRESTLEYHPSLPAPPHSASSYVRQQRSSPPPSSGGGRGYGRGGYSRPRERNGRDTRTGYHPPASRP